MFRPYLWDRTPSIGYSHLAQLVRDGFVTTILTTNWDHLAERALLQMLPFEDVRVLIRGEMPDDVIADVLKWRRSYVTVVKLHGDAQARTFLLADSETRRFDDRLTLQLRECLESCTFVVGQSAHDADVLSLLVGTERRFGDLYHVRFSETPGEIDTLLERVGAHVIHGPQPAVLAEGSTANVGEFDDFFVQLDLAVQQKLARESARVEQLRVAERSILDKERTGVGYINYSRITELVRHFTLEVSRLHPDLIVFIDDPSAPGGMELRRRMLPALKAEAHSIRTERLRIEGKSGSRTHKRSVTSDLSKWDMKDVRSVLILDSITFSGNTLELARRAVRERFPLVDVRVGVLVISQQLAERQAAFEESERILSQVVTDRYEIFFPWGVTQTTARFDRRFEGASKGQNRHVMIAKRPWGTIEVLVDREMSSLRLLTIEAGRKLSFQRHLCRDELFVALDDNIGLDICAEELSRDAEEYDEKVKSLILEKGDYVLVPRGVWHRTKASMDRVRLMEVSFGLYDQDNDIERRWDDYERERTDGRL
jgi:mannose-6-phosphate isomerase-like protein (cupin superfamily)